MLGVLITFLFCAGATLIGCSWSRRLLAELDPALQVGVAGLIGLGGIGLATFFLGSFGVLSLPPLMGFYLLLLGFAAFRLRSDLAKRPPISRPAGLDLIFPVVITVALLMSLFGVLAPSDANDWDTIAYHLAVPKIWLQQGRITDIPYIHHSHFPFAIDNLYLWGLQWGGQSAAKAFSLAITILGVLSIFGFARQRYGQRAGWWAATAFSTVPLVLWLSGTAYIDVGHGLYAGMAILFAGLYLEEADRRRLLLCGIMLAGAAATKYTGLQTIFAVALVLFVGSLLKKEGGAGFKAALLVSVLALLLASPWYLRNFSVKGNPVFPFFYGVLGGKGWDARRAEVYQTEQQTFGVGRDQPPHGSIQPQRVGHSIAGLAYQPGRYVNPGQTSGGGAPYGAMGFPLIAALFASMLGGRRGRFEGAAIAAILVSLGLWFFLSQQSRYILALAPPLAVLLGGLSISRLAPLIYASVAGQAVYSLWLMRTAFVDAQMQVVMGRVTQEEFLKARLPIYEPAQTINRLGKDAKVALYDEVFGFYLDVPYVWANPPHSMIIPYDEIDTGEKFVAEMRKLGFTHLYVSLSPAATDPEMRQLVADAFRRTPFPPQKREETLKSWAAKQNVLITDAYLEGRLEVVRGWRQGLLLQIKPE